MKASRRRFIQTAALGAVAMSTRVPNASASGTLSTSGKKFPPLKLGLMTYNLAKDWDIDTIIKNCAETGFVHA